MVNLRREPSVKSLDSTAADRPVSSLQAVASDAS